jgi:hypothetical protein
MASSPYFLDFLTASKIIKWSGKTRPVPGGGMKATLLLVLALMRPVTVFRAEKKKT